MLPGDLEAPQPRAHGGVLAVVELQHAGVLRDEADELPPQHVAAAQGVGHVPTVIQTFR